MGYKIGLDCKAYVDAAGVGGGTWAEVTIAQEVSLNLERAEAEIRNRAAGWVGILLGLKDATIEMELTYDPTDTEFEDLRDAFLNGTDIGLAIYDGAIATVGNEGLQADCKVTRFSRSEPLEEATTVSVTLRLSAASSTTPAWTEIAA